MHVDLVAERIFYRVRQMSNTTPLEIGRVIRSISPASNDENMIVIQRLAAHECKGTRIPQTLDGAGVRSLFEPARMGTDA